MVSGLLLIALGGCFVLLAIAFTVDMLRDTLPAAQPEERSPRRQRVMSWIWPPLFLALAVPCLIAGLSTSPFVTPADWPWTVIVAAGFLLGGILRVGKSLRGPRMPQRLQS
jgi:hypothetical protein